MSKLDEDILAAAEQWKREGRGVAIATVVETWGSAPRPVGSHLVIDDQQNFLGSVSGGCVEGDVISAAADVIESGKPQMLEFGVADETAWRAGLSCGGNIRVYVEKVD
ncbi:MAG: XdhC family protein [Bradyrhizobiaceae bacterium]|nr:XdhC family protein [Bradyrhizobiaceae bacterium]